MPIPEPIAIARVACTALIGQPGMALGLHVEWRRMMDGVRVSYIVVKSGERWLPRTFPSTDSKKKKRRWLLSRQIRRGVTE